MKQISLFIIVLLYTSLGNGQFLVLHQTLHLSGEPVTGIAHFSNQELLGHTYYLSLFEPGGKPVFHKMVWVEDNPYSFYFDLDEQLKTGHYTLQLTNYQNLAISHATSVLIVNAHSPELQKVNVQAKKIETPPNWFEVRLSNEIPGNTTSVKITPTEDLPSGIKKLSVNVFDLSQNSERGLSLKKNSTCPNPPRHSMASKGLNNWFRGFHIRGVLINPENQTPMTGVTMMLSYHSDQFHLSYTRTDENGRFGFYNLDFTGENEIILLPEKRVDTQYEISIENDRQHLIRPYPECDSNPLVVENLEETIRIRTLSRKVDMYYDSLIRPENIASRMETSPLFEYPDQNIILTDYVPFSSVKEIIKEIVPYVHLWKKQIRVFSPEKRKTFNNNPLLLLDGIPVLHDSVILNLDPKNIHSIQVLNTYSSISSYGQIGSGGIVSFITFTPKKSMDMVETWSIKGYENIPKTDRYRSDNSKPFFPPSLYWNDNLEYHGEFGFEMKLPIYPTSLNIEIFAELENDEVIYDQTTMEIADEVNK